MILDTIASIQVPPSTEISPKFLRFASYIEPGVAPFSVPVKPCVGGEPLDCHINVLRAISRDGGTSQTGWLLFDGGPKEGLHSMFHSVWRRPAGDLIDVTPSKPGAGGYPAPFLPSDIRYHGRCVPGHVLVTSPGGLDVLRGLLVYSSQSIGRQIVVCDRSIPDYAALFKNLIGPNGICICGTGLKAKKCCLPKIEDYGKGEFFVTMPQVKFVRG